MLAECDATHRTRMPSEYLLVLTCDDIPQTNFSITPTGERGAIRAKRNAIDFPLVSSECPLVFTRDGIPQSDGLVITPTGKCVPIRTKGDTTDPICMLGDQSDFLMGHRIVEPNTNTTGDREAGAVRRILYLTYRAFTETRFGPLRQVPLCIILSKGV